DFPFVPTTWIDGYVSWGSPSSARSASIRSSPKPSFGHGLSDSTSSTAEGIELPPVARELLAFGLHDVGGRALDEAVVREHPLRPRDLLLQALDLGRRVAVACRLRRPYDRLGIPVTEVVEREVVEGVDGVGEVEAAERGLDLCPGRIDTREDPALNRLLRTRLGPGTGRVRKDQTRHVPELVRELAALLDRPLREARVLRRGDLEQPVAGGIRAVLLDQLVGRDAVAQALRHPPPVRGEHHRVNDHVAEGDVAHQLETREDHPVLPEP